MPIRLPRVFEKDTAQDEEGVEVGNIPAHAGSFNAGGGELFAGTLNRPRADEVTTLPIRPVTPADGILLKVVENGGEYAPSNVAKRPLEFFIRLAREQLRPTYGQGFRGAPLQTDTEEYRPQTIRAGGSRAQVTPPTSEVSRSEEEVCA
jgi:hypothetical protein